MSTAFSLEERCAVVTGGSSGIGRAIALRFREAGARVLVADRRSSSDGFEFCQADVAQEADIVAMLEMARERFGRVDILVNNAGIQPLGVSFADLTPELLQRAFAVNVQGVALGIKHAARLLPEGGRIINMASFIGMIGAPRAAAYAPTKAAVIHLTRLAALELAPRQITVNAVSPSTIRTPAVTDIPGNPEIAFAERMTPLGRLGEPEEVAALCHFLAAKEAAYITGQNIAIDGGITAGWMEHEVPVPAQLRDGRWIDDP